MRILAAILLLTVLLGAAEGPLDSWDNLRQLRVGERVEVIDRQMKSHAGQFTAFTADAITLSGGIRIPKTDVASVKRRGNSHRRRNVLLGLVAGLAGGVVGGALHARTSSEEGETPVFLMVWVPIGAAIGAATGALLPTGGPVTIYRAGRSSAQTAW